MPQATIHISHAYVAVQMKDILIHKFLKTYPEK